MKTINIKKRKLLSFIMIAMITCIGLVTIGIMSMTTTSIAYAAESELSAVRSGAFYTNQERSINVLDQVMSDFRAEFVDADGKTVAVYSDNFSGRWIGCDGRLNIGTVVSGFSAMSANQFGGQVVYQQMRYSLNHLNTIKNIAVSLSPRYGIFTVAIFERYNFVSIYTTCDKYVLQIRVHLQNMGFYSEYGVNFEVDPYTKNELFLNRAYGGDGIFHTPDDRIGTMTVNVVCNNTLQLGILTNYHVAQAMPNNRPPIGVRRYHGGNFMGTMARGQMGTQVTPNLFRGPIDAAFIPYENQTEWQHTTRGRNNNQVFSNIRLGTNAQIVEGARVRTFGSTSGGGEGSIRNVNATVTLQFNGIQREMTNSFRFSIRSRPGDSGGPVFVESGNTLYLVGLLFGGHDGFLGAGARTYASRISEAMRILEVTPVLPNTFYDISILDTNSVRIDRPNRNLPASYNIPSRIFGRDVTAIGAGAFQNNNSVMIVNIPSTVTYIGAHAFMGARISGLSMAGGGDQPLTIGFSAFRDTPNLSNVWLHRVGAIEGFAFSNTGLTSVIIWSGAPNMRIEAMAFTHNAQLRQIYIPSEVTYIGQMAFWGSNNLTIDAEFLGKPSGWDLRWNAGNRPVRWLANPSRYFRFRNIDGAMEIYGYVGNPVSLCIPETITINGVTRPVTSISSSFRGSRTLRNLTIPNTVRIIGESAFSNMHEDFRISWNFSRELVRGQDVIRPHVNRVTVAHDASWVPNNAFDGFYRLTDVRFATIVNGFITEYSSMRRIGAYAFRGTGISSINIPYGVIGIGRDAFRHTPIWNNTPNNSVVYVSHWAVGVRGQLIGNYAVNFGTFGIADRAFAQQRALRNISIPTSVWTVGLDAFWDTRLDSMTIQDRFNIDRQPIHFAARTFANSLPQAIFVSEANRQHVYNALPAAYRGLLAVSAVRQAGDEHSLDVAEIAESEEVIDGIAPYLQIAGKNKRRTALFEMKILV